MKHRFKGSKAMLYDWESTALKSEKHGYPYTQARSMRIDNHHPNTPRPTQM